MKKNKNMNTNVNDMFEVLATLIPDLVDTIMDDTNEDINKENKNRKCNYKCHCSCCDDDISLQDLLGDLPSLDELLDDNNDEDIVAKISPETNQRIKENETKIKNKTKLDHSFFYGFYCCLNSIIYAHLLQNRANMSFCRMDTYYQFFRNLGIAFTGNKMF